MPSERVVEPLHNNVRDLLCAVAVDSVTDAGVGVEGAVGNGFLHEVCVAHRCHAVVFAPEEIGRHGDLLEEWAEIFPRHEDQRLLHEG